jgi:hypothetical protein
LIKSLAPNTKYLLALSGASATNINLGVCQNQHAPAGTFAFVATATSTGFAW